MRKTSLKWGVLPLVAVALVSGCAAVPAGPSVRVLPGIGKPFEDFQADDSICRQWAGQQVVQWRYDIAYQQCMYARGNQIPSVVPASRPGVTPPPPPVAPPPPGVEPAPPVQAPAPGSS